MKFRIGRIAAELLVVFVGVTAAFIVENHRKGLEERRQLNRTKEAILIELVRFQIKGVQHADSISVRIERWKAQNQAGRRTIPKFYRIPGAPSPPTAAWDEAVSSGIASMFDPELRLALGYFYSEFLGIHQNYIRRLEFIENVALPAAQHGVDAFYDSAGELKAEFKVQTDLMMEFSDDLRKVCKNAGELEAWIRTGHPQSEHVKRPLKR